jgi:hypothetical protein
MDVRVLLLMVPLAAGAQPPALLDKALSRLSEEAEVFSQAARRTVGKEVLHQKAMMAPGRFRIRVGEAARKAEEPRWQVREVISEYGFSSLKDAPEALHEFRQVISVDGRPQSEGDKARDVLVRGVVSEDDRLKQKMLRDFEKHGLRGAAFDFGQLILLFTRGNLINFRFTPAGSGRIGADAAVIYAFRQTQGHQALTVFEGREAIRVPLEGTIWFRKSDLVPLRIILVTERAEKDRRVRDQAVVEYFVTARGSVMPASVVHKQWVNSQIVVENRFQYSDFRRFSAEAEIKFEAEPEAPKP